MGVTGDRLRTMAAQIDNGQLDKDGTAAQLRQLSGDVDRVEDGAAGAGGNTDAAAVQTANQDRANAAGAGGTNTQNQTGQQGPRGSW